MKCALHDKHIGGVSLYAKTSLDVAFRELSELRGLGLLVALKFSRSIQIKKIEPPIKY